MTQPSVANYFNTRKRTATESLKQPSAKRVILDQNVEEREFNCPTPDLNGQENDDVDQNKRPAPISTGSVNEVLLLEQNDGQAAPLENFHGSKVVVVHKQTETEKKIKPARRTSRTTSQLRNQPTIEEVIGKEQMKIKSQDDPELSHRTPPSSPVKVVNAMDKTDVANISSGEVKRKLVGSRRLELLKATMNRLKEKENQLKEIEKKIETINKSVNLKEFKDIELEVHLSPQKSVSPQKQYLSPKKDTSARRNLINLLSPTKNAVPLPAPSLKTEDDQLLYMFTLPYKYRYLSEVFRSIDIASQMMFNRKETITFRNLKPAVETMLKRNLTQEHLSQIKAVYEESYSFVQEKLRVFGLGGKRERWELVIKPNVKEEVMTSSFLLERRKKFNDLLVERVSRFHDEFLESIGVSIPKESLKRWHINFDYNNVPDIEGAALPQPPEDQNKVVSGKEVLEKSKELFKCNPRMESALQRLKAEREQQEMRTEEDEPKNPLLKGIPRSILEKVRQRQAAKAIENMTRSTAKEKEIQIYRQLPEIARLTRNVFVTEKKNVLPLESVVEKLTNSFKTFKNKSDIESNLKLLAKEVPGWLEFIDVRATNYLKISKEQDLTIIITKLESITKAKIEN